MLSFNYGTVEICHEFLGNMNGIISLIGCPIKIPFSKKKIVIYFFAIKWLIQNVGEMGN